MKKITVILLFFVAVILFASCYAVDNTESVIIIRLGEPVRVVDMPGLHIKIPFIESAVSITNRILYSTSQPSQVITKDKKSILIDYYCQWKVLDPLQLYKSVRNEIGAMKRLENIIYSGMRMELPKHDLVEIINANRRTIMTNVTEAAGIKAKTELGIEIIDIRLKRADLPKENENNIFARMITERERIAKQYRSEGQEEAQKIRAKTDTEVAVMLAEAEKNAQILRGKADAEAIALYAKAFSSDPSFYEFNKIIGFYSDSKHPMKIIISTDSKMFKLLKDNK
ncbi:MAG: protease modulator HflC [Deferribacteraceae bacterium]|jgi:membrane protease subunit HflC|nr:protease modulator HflC [Deferribacteraceae bacterium]